MFSPKFPYQTKEMIWNLLTEACTMQCQKPCTWSQRATSFTHKALSLTRMIENTHYKEAKYNMPCGMHMFERNPGDKPLAPESLIVSLYIWNIFNQWETCFLFFCKNTMKGRKILCTMHCLCFLVRKSFQARNVLTYYCMCYHMGNISVLNYASILHTQMFNWGHLNWVSL